MKLHANAATCPNARLKIVCRALAGEAREKIAADHEISEQTVAKWVARYRAEGEAGLVDRARRPGRCHVARRRIVRRRSPHCGGCG